MTTMDQVASCIGQLLGVSDHRIDYFLNNHVPLINQSQSELQIGRVTLPLFKSTKISHESGSFAWTSLAIKNLERIASSVAINEPVLLVGETGTGKTTIVQKLASLLGHKLSVINMSQQSDSTDLLGGFKPLDLCMIAGFLKERFETLFAKTFSVKQNQPFLDAIRKAYTKKRWEQLIVGFNNAVQMSKKNSSTEGKRKKIKIEGLAIEWEVFANEVYRFKKQVESSSNFLFSFVEGALVKAIKEGHWILLDEINLATQETLECLSGLLESHDSSVLLLERGDTTPVQRHPNFRIFGCMNPAGDAGKRQLSSSLLSRFTEFWIDSPDGTPADLIMIIKGYLGAFIPPGQAGEAICSEVASFYEGCKQLSKNGVLFDGADCRVVLSMRTLTRALSCAANIAPTYGIRRSLYEGCYMTFMTGLNVTSFSKVRDLLVKYVLSEIKNPQTFVRQIPANPQTDDAFEQRFVLVGSFWIEKGSVEVPIDIDSRFVLTPSVQVNLCNLARGCLSKKYPVLIQGPTSAGKTSMIEYLALKTGHRFIRINNHEHTDLQEYLGGYMTDSQGVLVFQEVFYFNLGRISSSIAKWILGGFG